MPNYYPYQYYPQQQMAQPSIQPSTTQNGNFVSVRNEAEARNFPVGYGNSVNFKDENAPYIYVKTMGLSQFDNPTFEKYRLVKEMPSDEPKSAQNGNIDIEAINSTIDKINSEIEAIWLEIEALKNAKEKSVARSRNSKRDENGDDRHDEQCE